MRSFFQRSQPKPPLHISLLAGLGGALAIALVSGLSLYGGTPLIMAPFGASCVLLFSVPASPLSQPANVIGGHLLATVIGLTLRMLLPDAWWAAALAVGLAIGLMSVFRLTHPPAGADPLVIFAADPDVMFLFFPTLSGAIILVTAAVLYHRSAGVTYPLRSSV
jgi:CBS-domain-containing membrane protein